MKEIKSNGTRRQRIIVGIIVLLLGSVVLGSLWQTWAAPEPGRFAPNLLWGVLMLGLLMAGSLFFLRPQGDSQGTHPMHGDHAGIQRHPRMSPHGHPRQRGEHLEK